LSPAAPLSGSDADEGQANLAHQVGEISRNRFHVMTGRRTIAVVVMDGGPSGLMYILRADALEAQRGDSPDLSTIYAPGTPRQARRRLVAVWALSVFWIIGAVLGGLMAFVSVFTTFTGLVLAVSTQFEAAWIGSPIRPWTLYSMPVALSGIILALVVL
jgi:hypothetical protein